MRKFCTLSFLSCVLYAAGAAAQTVTGSGTTNIVPVFTGSSALGNSPIAVSGSNVGIGATNPQGTLQVGTSDSTNSLYLSSSAPYQQAAGTNRSNMVIGSSSQFTVARGETWRWMIGQIANNPAGYGSSFALTRATRTQGDTSVDSVDLVDMNGNIGIGTSMPGARLDVQSVVSGYGIKMGFGTGGGSDWLLSNSFYSASNQSAAALVLGTFDTSGQDFYISTKNSPSGYAAVFKANGSVGIGTTSPNAKLEVSGNIKLTSGSGGSMTFADGTTQTTAWTGTVCGGDYAESVDVSGERKHYEPGDVLVIDPSSPGKFLKSAEPYSTMVTGVYSTKPGTVGRRQLTPKSEDEVPMAMIGIVPVKVATENGPIRSGDLLVTSSKVGYAMKGTDRSQMLGAVIGKALGTLNQGTGVIEVVVTLQ